MKAFDKWFNEEPTENEKGYCMVAWRAALEHIVNQMNTNKFMDNGELRTYIEQELKD